MVLFRVLETKPIQRITRYFKRKKKEKEMIMSKGFQRETEGLFFHLLCFFSVLLNIQPVWFFFSFSYITSLVKEESASTFALPMVWFAHFTNNVWFQLPRGSSLRHETMFSCGIFQLTGIPVFYWPKQGNIQSKSCSRLAWPAPNPCLAPVMHTRWPCPQAEREKKGTWRENKAEVLVLNTSLRCLAQSNLHDMGLA